MKTIESIIDSFRNKKVLIVGDVMVDAYVFGKVDRISPEAPVPVINVESRENRLGGRSIHTSRQVPGEPLARFHELARCRSPRVSASPPPLRGHSIIVKLHPGE